MRNRPSSSTRVWRARLRGLVALHGLVPLASSAVPMTVTAQEYDILLKGGHVIDARNGISGRMDVAVARNTIARVATEIPADRAGRVIDVSGLYVVPGLVDLHTHVFYGTEPDRYLNNSYAAVPADAYGAKYGTTTMVDAGSAGWRNFEQFKAQAVDQSQTRVLAFLNIVGEGMKGGHFEQNLHDMDPKMTARVVRSERWLVGVKLAHYQGHDWEPVHRLVEAGELADVPVMIDFGSAEPPLSIETLLLEKLRPGDIYTHMYGGGGAGREAVIDRESVLRPGVLAAQRRGVLFDVGHGGASFAWHIAVPAFRQGLRPDLISTDLHRSSASGGMRNLLNVMSKFLNLGMSLEDVVARATWAPAQAIKRPELGHLTEGAEADIAVLNLREGEFGFVDAQPGEKLKGRYKLECEMTLRAGRIVWDLNGLSAIEWTERAPRTR